MVVTTQHSFGLRLARLATFSVPTLEEFQATPRPITAGEPA